MEAIIEFIAAVLLGFVQALVGLIGATFAFLAAILEFAFIALTQGRSAASNRYQRRKQERAEGAAAKQSELGSPLSHDSLSHDSLSHDSLSHDSLSRATGPSGHKRFVATALVLFFVIVCVAGTVIVRDRIQKERVAKTRAQIKLLADTVVDQFKRDGAAKPEAGKMVERDAWRQSIELFVDESLLGALIVLRSSGPDGKSGSLDDLLAVRVIRFPAKDIGGELAIRGVQAIRDRVAKLLPEGAPEQLPENIDGGEE